MKCPRCNAQLTDDASFCGICGFALSAPKASMPEARPASTSPEATLVAGPWPDGQPVRSAPPLAAPTGWSGGQPGSFQPTQPPQAGSWPQQTQQGQPSPQAGSWPQYPPQAGNQPQAGAAPVRRNDGAMVRRAPRKRRRAGCLWSALIVLLVLIGGLVGAWFLGVRPYLHNLAQSQLDQALTTPENQILLSMLAVPPGVPLPAKLRVIHGTEEAMNNYLSAHGSDQVQNLHMAIASSGMTLSFTAYGQNCVISVTPVLASDGQLQVTNVQVQGVLALIMSNDELTAALNDNLQQFSTQMTHKITSIKLLEHEIDVQFS